MTLASLPVLLRSLCLGEMAHELEDWIRADARFEVVAPVLFSLVCFRLKGEDEPNRKLLEAVNRSGVALTSATSPSSESTSSRSCAASSSNCPCP